jgi:hypothetical protein
MSKPAVTQADQPGAFSVQERAGGSQPAWVRENSRASDANASDSQPSDSHLPPELRALPPEMRGFVEDISDSVPEDFGMSTGGGDVNTRPSSLKASVTLTGAPQTEEKTHTRKWYYIIGIFLVVLVAAVGAGVGVALSGSDDDSFESSEAEIRSIPTQAPVQVAPQCNFQGIDPNIAKLPGDALARYEMLLEDFAAQVVPDFTAPVNPDDYCTPSNLALIWLASDDENSLFSEEQLRNRYILGIFHVATNGVGWLNKTGWLTDATECQWFGVTCDDGGKIITELKLPDNGLKSTIPSEIGLLSGLQGLYLPRNELVGLVPSTIGALSNLSKYSVWSHERITLFYQELTKLIHAPALPLSFKLHFI